MWQQGPIAILVLSLTTLGGCTLMPSGDTDDPPAPVVVEKRVQALSPTRDRLIKALEDNGLSVEARGRGVAVLLPGSLFAFGSSDIEIGAGDNIRVVAEVLNRNFVADRMVVVEGHTDSLGSAEYNLALSQWRAEAVRDELIFSGVPGSRIDVAWYGESRPIAVNRFRNGEDNPAGRARNRRVEILILDPRQ